MRKGSQEFSHREKLSPLPVSLCWMVLSPQFDDVTYLLLFVL